MRADDGSVSRSVHPRAGGEHPRRSSFVERAAGSSPRGRGTLNELREVLVLQRFIPARAGNTSTRGFSPSARSVHPRAGGEHWILRVQDGMPTGSSPRGRGTPLGGRFLRAEHRFIPARAGNTTHCRRNRTRSAVHPRAGGEHNPAGYGALKARGSSPRGRGTLLCHPSLSPSCRFIPARAGNTQPAAEFSRESPVHPRAGGEHFGKNVGLEDYIGSSPRGRGTRFSKLLDLVVARFIPARAGNTASPASTATGTSVHPRAGGEHLVKDGGPVLSCQ